MFKQSAWMKENGMDLGLLLVRLAAGVIFVMHGYDKLFGKIGMDAFTKMVEGIGFPLPALFAYLAALTEFLGGLALIFGVFTCYAGALLAIVMLVAMTAVKGWALPKGDVDLILMATALMFAFGHPGKFTAKKFLGKN